MISKTERGRPFSHVHLQWFAPDPPKPDGGATEPKAGGKPGDASTPGQPDPGKTATETVSKSDFDHLLKVHEEMKTKLQKREAAEAKAKEEALKEQGKYAELHATVSKELEAIKPRLERYESVIKQLLEQALKELPEGFDATLIPDGDPDQKLAWLSKAQASGLLKKPEAKKPTGDGSPDPGGVPTMTWADTFKPKKA